MATVTGRVVLENALGRKRSHREDASCLWKGWAMEYPRNERGTQAEAEVPPKGHSIESSQSFSL